MEEAREKVEETTSSNTDNNINNGDLDEEEAWGTLEELLLVCAVNRHGTHSWDSIAKELQKRIKHSSSSPSPLSINNDEHERLLESSLFSSHNCRRKYVHLKRRFCYDEVDGNGGGDGDGDGDGEGEEHVLRMVDELRKLRVEELKRQVHRHDASIVSLQLKVKKLEEEREMSKVKEEDEDEDTVLSDLRKKPEENVRLTGEKLDEQAEKVIAADSAENRSCNESNSTNHLHDHRNNKTAVADGRKSKFKCEDEPVLKHQQSRQRGKKMDSVNMEGYEKMDDSSAIFSARSYQLEAFEKAKKQNTIVFLETGSGKTLIAVMLLQRFAHELRRPKSSYIAVFLVPTVVLVTQQAKVIEMHTDLKVGKYWGDMGVDFWDAATWQKEQEKHEVLVMTPMILFDALSHTYIKLEKIKVLIFDECHNAKKNHPYARIMMDFYHRQLHTTEVPRILGMTASLINAKVKGSESDAYWKDICALENLMNSKVYTCDSEAILAEYIPFPNAKALFYNEDVPNALQKYLINNLTILRQKHLNEVKNMGIEKSAEEAVCSKLKKLSNTFLFCLEELGFWAALKAAEIVSSEDTEMFIWGELDVHGETLVKAFNSEFLKQLSIHKPSGGSWSISYVKANVEDRLISSKVLSLVESVLCYRSNKDLRCIIFVERVVTAMVLETILDQLLFEASGWRTKYIAGNFSTLKCQSRKQQNRIVDDFRRGEVHILVATSILEEGLDVQSCNLVVRFDLSANVCSFIQSRGRARMQNSDFLLMIRSGDKSQLTRVENYLCSGDLMRKESLSHASISCQPATFSELDNIFYRVPSTGAIVTLSSSISLVYHYCSRLPSDGYFKPMPRFTIDELAESCTIQFPNSCPLQSVTVKGNKKILKHLACLVACKHLHERGALTDNLVPDILVEERLIKETESEPYCEDQAIYIPPEIVGEGRCSTSAYHSYIMELKQNFNCDIPVHDIVLLSKSEFASDVGSMQFDMEVDWGNMSVKMKYAGRINLTDEQVACCRRFQVAVLRVLRDGDFDSLVESLKGLYLCEKNVDVHASRYDYLLIPRDWLSQKSVRADLEWISSSSFLLDAVQSTFTNRNKRKCVHQANVYTKNGFVDRNVLENCLVCTPHNGHLYAVSGFLDGLDGNSILSLSNGESKSYKSYFKERYNTDLLYENQTLLCGRKVFKVKNYLLRCKQRREKESSGASVELPPELCLVIISPISVATLYTYSFIPSIMHRVEALMLSANLRSIIMDHCMQNVYIPVTKVLEAITSKHCQEKFHLESLETLGDSFLKYAVCQQLFNTNQNNHEGLLSIKKERIISNAALCKLGSQQKLPGFLRNHSFDPKYWVIPGDLLGNCELEEEFLTTTYKVYRGKSRKIKSKRVADMVEALIGAFLSSGGEVASLLFMKWLGLEVDFCSTPYYRSIPVNPRMLVNISRIESILNYTFKDPSVVVEAMTHGSYMLPEIPRCYQRLEFLGDAVLDHLITVHLYSKFPDMTPGLLTDLRSAQVNNECYALCAVRAGLHKHILHASQALFKQMGAVVASFQQSSLESTFGWESNVTFPKVLADIIESLAGAIYVDSGFDKEVVFKCIAPLLEPLVSPETLKLNPIRELHYICLKHHYVMTKKKACENGVASFTLEVEANGVVHSHTCSACDKKTAKKIASREVLKSLKLGLVES